MKKEATILLSKQGGILKELKVDDIAINPIFKGPAHNHSVFKSKLIRLGLKPRKIYINHNRHPNSAKKNYPILHNSVADRFNLVSNYRPSALTAWFEV